jgi:Fe-S-cluster-containing dehydrogenase component
MTRYGMVIDAKRCVRCHACTVACKAENGTPASVSWHTILDEEVGTYPNTTRVFIPKPCYHCDNPACVTVCPTKASHVRSDGIVLIDYDKCIGCKYCIAACPYGVRVYMDKIEGYFPEVGLTALEQVKYAKFKLNTVTKCTFCVDRVDSGVAKGLKPGVDRDATPACVITCPAKARIFGDLDDPNSEVSKAARVSQALLPHANTSPSVSYTGTLPSFSLIKNPNVQVVPVDTLAQTKDAIKVVAAAGAAAVVLAAVVNMAKSGKDKEEVKK